MKTIELTEVEVEILLELLGSANPTWKEDLEKVYSLWHKLLEMKLRLLPRGLGGRTS